VNRARERLAELIDIDLPRASQRAARRAPAPAQGRTGGRFEWTPTANAA